MTIPYICRAALAKIPLSYGGDLLLSVNLLKLTQQTSV